MDEQNQSDARERPSSLVSHPVSLDSAGSESLFVRLAFEFAGGVGFGELPSIRQGDGKYFAATPPAWRARFWFGSRPRQCCSLDPRVRGGVPAAAQSLLGRCAAAGRPIRPHKFSHRTIVPRPTEPVLIACRRQTGHPLRPRKSVCGLDRCRVRGIKGTCKRGVESKY